MLRVGGDSTDWTWWPVPHMRKPPGIRFTLTPRWMSVAHALASDLDAQLILGINLEADSRRLADAEAKALIARVGRPAIDALEIGNEPELYGSFGWYRTASGQEITGRPHGYDESDFFHEFSSFSRSLPRAPVAGPSSGSLTWLAELGTFLRDDPRVEPRDDPRLPAQALRNDPGDDVRAALRSVVAWAGAGARAVRPDRLRAPSPAARRRDQRRLLRRSARGQ